MAIHQQYNAVVGGIQVKLFIDKKKKESVDLYVYLQTGSWYNL